MSFIQFFWMSGIISTLQGPLAPIHFEHMHAAQVSASNGLNVTETEYFSHGLHQKCVHDKFIISIVTIYKKDGIDLVG